MFCSAIGSEVTKCIGRHPTLKPSCPCTGSSKHTLASVIGTAVALVRATPSHCFHRQNGAVVSIFSFCIRQIKVTLSATRSAEAAAAQEAVQRREARLEAGEVAVRAREDAATRTEALLDAERDALKVR